VVPRHFLFPVSLIFLGIAGCASVPADGGRGDVLRLTAEHGRAPPHIADANSFTSQALSAPLTADTAVQLALINNPNLRKQTAALGFAAADLYDAGRLANPTFSLTRLAGDSSAGANVPQLTLGIAFNFVNLLFLPANSRFARDQFEATKLDVSAATLDLAAEVETAWYEAVGAEQLAQMREAAAKAQRASADLAKRYFDAGNINARELAMERASASQAVLASLSARAAAVEAHSTLNRLMGLPAAQSSWTLDARLAEPLPQEDDVQALQRLALDSRLDVAALRRRSQAIASRFGLTRHTRFINSVEIGVERERDFDGALDVGPTLSLELPLFNWGGGRVAAAQAALDQAEAELDGRVLDVSNDVAREAAKVQALRQLAQEYRDVLVPQREAVAARMQEEQNYMLIGVFEVLAAKQQEYEAYAGYIDAVRSYWASRSALARAVGRRLPSSEQAAEATIDASQIVAPKRSGMDHSMHSMSGMDHAQHGGSPKPSSDPHAGHAMPNMTPPSSGMEGMEGMDHGAMPMEGMDHSQHKMPSSAPAAEPHAGHSMPGMHHAMPDVAPGGEPPEACKQATVHPDDTVNRALTQKCGETPSADPHAGHAAMPLAPDTSPPAKEPSHEH
jgi:cobalt-zinc-cadmium efflux system outer membrane protein